MHMNDMDNVEKLKRLKELSEFYDYGDKYKLHIKRIKKEIKRRMDDKRG